MANRANRNKDAKVTNPVLDFEIGGTRHRIYALNKGQHMHSPARPSVTYNGPGIVWHEDDKNGERVHENDVNNPAFWNALGKLVAGHKGVTMHSDTDSHRKGDGG